MLGFGAIGSLPVSALPDTLMHASMTSEMVLTIEVPMLAMLTDPDAEVVFAVEIYPGIATDRVAIV